MDVHVPWIGQQTLLTDVLGNKPLSPLIFVVVGVVNVVIAVAAVRATAGLLPREDHLRTVESRNSRDQLSYISTRNWQLNGPIADWAT